MSEIKPGDRVRVTYEGTWEGGRTTTEMATPNGSTLPMGLRENVTVEKIEPPVEVFGPGAYVRHKAATYMKFLVLDNGYVDLQNNLCWRDCTDSFTSEDYERIEMAEVPL